jgi:hypothetical protein
MAISREPARPSRRRGAPMRTETTARTETPARAETTARAETMSGQNEGRARWDDTARTGTIIRTKEDVEPGKSASFTTKFFGFAFWEDIFPAIITAVICVLLVLLLLKIGVPTIGNGFIAILPYIMVLILAFAAIGGMFSKGLAGGFGMQAAGKIAGWAFTLVTAIPGAIFRAVRRPVHDIILTPLRGSQDRQVTVYRYQLKRWESQSGRLSRGGKRLPRGGNATDRSVDQCTVRMRGVHQGVVPAEGDKVTFEGKVNPRTHVFEAVAGTLESTGERIIIELPKWGR